MRVEFFGYIVPVLLLILLRPRKWWKWLLIIVGGILLVIALALSPIQDLFSTFDSPQAAYDFKYEYIGETILDIHGEESSMLLIDNGLSFVPHIFEKTDDGWKVGTPFDEHMRYRTEFRDFVVFVYQYKDTDDYYVWVQDRRGKFKNLTDNCGNEFTSYRGDTPSFIETHTLYVAYVKDFQDDYTLMINGKPYKVLDKLRAVTSIFELD